MPRVFVACVPRRRAASSARRDSCTRGPLNFAPKAVSSSAIVFEAPRTGASAICTDLHEAVARPGHGATKQHEVLGGIEADDLEPLLGNALVAHLARSADALEHARGRGRGADRTRGAHVVRTVAYRTAAEVVALHGALEALALGDAGDLDLLALLERLDGHGVAHLQLTRFVAELAHVAEGTGVGLREVPALGLRDALLLDHALC